MCGCFCIGFIDFKFSGKTLNEYTSLFSPYDFLKKWQYNFELFKKWVEQLKHIQIWAIRQNLD